MRGGHGRLWYGCAIACQMTSIVIDEIAGRSSVQLMLVDESVDAIRSTHLLCVDQCCNPMPVRFGLV